MITIETLKLFLKGIHYTYMYSRYLNNKVYTMMIISIIIYLFLLIYVLISDHSSNACFDYVKLNHLPLKCWEAFFGLYFVLPYMLGTQNILSYFYKKNDHKCLKCHLSNLNEIFDYKSPLKFKLYLLTLQSFYIIP